MILFELYNPLQNETLGIFKSLEEAHVFAKDLFVYEIVVISISNFKKQRELTISYIDKDVELKKCEDKYFLFCKKNQKSVELNKENLKYIEDIWK